MLNNFYNHTNATNFSNTESITKETLPFLLSSKEAKKIGISRSMFYKLVNQDGNFTVKIGERLFIHRDKFFEWLDRIADCGRYY